jgi:hypothetical protein
VRAARKTAGLPCGRWTNRKILTALSAAYEAGYEPDLMRDALHAIALDSKTLTPGRLKHDGPWWEASERRRRGASSSTPIEATSCSRPNCDESWLVDKDGVPIEKCPECHPAYRGATA